MVSSTIIVCVVIVTSVAALYFTDDKKYMHLIKYLQ